MMCNDLAGREFYIASHGEYAVCTGLIADDHGFMACYLIELESGGTMMLHEDRLWAAGLIERTVH